MIETYNIITIGVLDEDKKFVGITEENFKNLLKKAEKLMELEFEAEQGVESVSRFHDVGHHLQHVVEHGALPLFVAFAAHAGKWRRGQVPVCASIAETCLISMKYPRNVHHLCS